MAVEQAQFTISAEVEAAEILQGLLDVVADEKPAQTGASRKAQIAEALKTTDLDELIALQEKLEGFIDRILDNRIDLDDTSPLDAEELYGLMLETLDADDVKRLLEIRYQMRRTRFFSHVTEVHRLNGVPDPEYAPGEAVVPELQRRFTREGGKAKATLDYQKLREALGEERWEQISRTTVIPERTETHLSEDALMSLVHEDPAVLEIIRECVVAGNRTPQSFHVRNLEKK